MIFFLIGSVNDRFGLACDRRLVSPTNLHEVDHAIFHFAEHHATISLWVFLKCFQKSSMAITSTAEVLKEATGAHAPLKKGGITSDEENKGKYNAEEIHLDPVP